MICSFPTVCLQNNSSPWKETPNWSTVSPTFPSPKPPKHPSTLCPLPARWWPHPRCSSTWTTSAFCVPSLACMACEPHLEGGVSSTPAWRRVLRVLIAILLWGWWGSGGAYRISKSGWHAPQETFQKPPQDGCRPRSCGPRCSPLWGAKMSSPNHSWNEVPVILNQRARKASFNRQDGLDLIRGFQDSAGASGWCPSCSVALCFITKGVIIYSKKGNIRSSVRDGDGIQSAVQSQVCQFSTSRLFLIFKNVLFFFTF